MFARTSRRRQRPLYSILAFILLIAPLQGFARSVLYGIEVFERDKEKPVTVRDAFSVDASQAALLRAHNRPGADVSSDDGTPATAGEILLNGLVVVRPADLGEEVSIVEVPVQLVQGANELAVTLFGKPGSGIAVEIVARTELRPGPTQAAVEAARIIHETIPGAGVQFSQLHGRPIRISGAGSLVPEERPRPLVAAPPPDDQLEPELLRASTMLKFFEQFKGAWGLQSAAEDLAIQTRTGDAPLQHGDPKSGNIFFRRGLIGQELVQMHQGLPILGRYAIGQFDFEGNLYELTTRLIPVPAGLDATPLVAEKDVLPAVQQQLGIWLPKVPALAWLLEPPVDRETAIALLWMPAASDFDAMLRLAYEVHVRDALNIARFCVDAKTGAVFCASSPLPTDWPDAGIASLQTAPDEGGTDRTFPTTRFDFDGDSWIMGFGSNFIDGGLRYFTGVSRLGIHDAGGVRSRGGRPLTISAGGGNTWASDPSWTGSRRAAASAMDNIRLTLNWWRMRNWASWNGDGSGGVGISINNRCRPGSSPERNACSAWGLITIGDAALPVTNRTLASSLETIGHEFMHSVIDATSDLVYRNESGATNEALADIFGTALTAVGDGFNDSTIGEDIDGNAPFRDMLNPPAMGQPDRYSNFVTTWFDNGGVHTNSGILNKAHGLLVGGGTGMFRSIPVPALGMNNTTQLLQAINQRRVFSRNATMEEFAVAAVGYCELVEALSRVLGEDPGQTCAAFNKAYRAVELLPSLESDIAIQRFWARNENVSRMSLRTELVNKSPVDIVLASELSVAITNEVGESITASSVPGFGESTWGGCWALRAPLLEATENGCLYTTFPIGAFDGYLTGPRFYMLEAFTPGVADPTPADNLLRIRVASDYQPLGAFNWMTPTATGVKIETVIRNAIGGFPAGLSAVFLSRDTAHGPLLPVSPQAEDTLESNAPPTCSSTFPMGCHGADTNPQFPGALITGTGFKVVLLPTARRALGGYEVWFDSAGGLPILEGQRQLYMLVDSGNLADETDETNNLMCVNCVAPGQRPQEPGVIVRIRPGTDIGALFPAKYTGAAARLPSPRAQYVPTVRIIENNLPYILPAL